MKESIVIKNFGPVCEAEILDIKPMMVFIGESGSGKSTIMKVIAMCQWIYKMMCIRSFLTQSGISQSFRIRLDSCLKENGLIGCLRADSYIKYTNGSVVVEVSKQQLKGTSNKVPTDERTLEKIVFISDARSVIPNLLEQNTSLKKMFYLNDTLENYLTASDTIKQFKISDLGIMLDVRKSSQGTKHFISSISNNDNYTIRLKDASSGMQNVVPMNLIIEYFSQYYDLVGSMNQSILSYVLKGDNWRAFKPTHNISDFKNKRVTIFVEEPELSLYPTNQLHLIDYMVNRCFVSTNKKCDMNLCIATHSPYIINYLNVLLKRDQSAQSFLEFDQLAVYRVYDGRLQNLLGIDEAGKPIVDSYDLSETMQEIYDEYNLLCKL